MLAPANPAARTTIRRWLVLIALMVYAMILIGGMTRLTDSGLSITEWAPIKGALPPLSDAAWQSEFAKYRETSEYRLVNKGMSLDEFKFIYGWEWAHRFFGRLIGLVAVGGFAFFAMKKWLSPPLRNRLLILIALGGLQGAIGWWMVSSGIGETHRVDVAPYRLMTHFMLALIIIVYAQHLWLTLGATENVSPQPGKNWARALFVLVLFQMALGALVAGLDSGRSYNDWPLMAGELVPQHYIEKDLGMRSLFEGRAATQFNHRLLAYILWAASLIAAWRFRKSQSARGFAILAALISAQALWGIVTLLNAAPMGLALIHQALGVIVTLAAARLVFATSSRSAAATDR